MKIIHFSVRYSEGGAARVAREIHEQSLKIGIESKFVYGYSKGIEEASEAKNDLNAIRLGFKFNVISNYLLHGLIGIDLVKPPKKICLELEHELASADIIHIHVVHSYYVPLGYLFDLCARYSKKIVITAHDHWWVTGRCAFTDGCTSWIYGCGNCKTKNNYPAAFFDFSKKWLINKKKYLIDSFERVSFVSPSKHLAVDIKKQYPKYEIDIVPNSIDYDFQCLADSADYSSGKHFDNKVDLLIVAADLSYGGKTNYDLIVACSEIPGVKIHCVGKNSPFIGDKFINYGEVKSRKELLQLYVKCDALIFSSIVDNYPLVLCEAGYAGLPILSTSSSAADEILRLFDAVCLDTECIKLAIGSGDFFRAYSSIKSRSELRSRAKSLFGTDAMIDGYVKLYRRICASG